MKRLQQLSPPSHQVHHLPTFDYSDFSATNLTLLACSPSIHACVVAVGDIRSATLESTNKKFGDKSDLILRIASLSNDLNNKDYLMFKVPPVFSVVAGTNVVCTVTQESKSVTVGGTVVIGNAVQIPIQSRVMSNIPLEARCGPVTNPSHSLERSLDLEVSTAYQGRSTLIDQTLNGTIIELAPGTFRMILLQVFHPFNLPRSEFWNMHLLNDILQEFWGR